MITYVNTVLVGTGVGALVNSSLSSVSASDAGKYVVVDNDGTVLTAATAAKAEAIKVGLVSNKTTVNQKTGASMPVINWSNIIKKADLKSYSYSAYAADTEDIVTIDLTSADGFAGKRIVVRLTYKDLPTRYRKWSESYDFLCSANESKASLAAKIATKINKEHKRARVIASVGVINTTEASGIPVGDGTHYFHVDANWGTENPTTGTVVMLEAMKYTDDDVVDTINVYNKVRFNANVWMTDPVADGFAKNNKYSVPGVSIVKNPGKTYTASWKLVRDAEAQAMGYLGILNRGEGTWPIIKPDMNTQLNAHYDSLTIEFENMYRAADDIQRKTKQTLQIFEHNGHSTDIKTVLDAFVGNESTSTNAKAKGTSDVADKNTAYTQSSQSEQQ